MIDINTNTPQLERGKYESPEIEVFGMEHALDILNDASTESFRRTTEEGEWD